MKKLIVCLAAVGLAVGAQAATYNWKTDSNMQGVNATGVTDNGNYTAGTTNMKGQGTWNVVLALYDVATGDLVGESSSTSIKFSTTGSKANTGIEVAAAEQGQKYNFKLTITGSQTALTGRGEDTDAGFDYSSAILTTIINGQVETAAFGPTTLKSDAPSAWTISGITALQPDPGPGPGPGPGPDPLPEPTSGLLLLVGAAMLGLRRKRA